KYSNNIKNIESRRCDFGVLTSAQSLLNIDNVTWSCSEITSGYGAPVHAIYMSGSIVQNTDCTISNVIGEKTIESIGGSVLFLFNTQKSNAFNIVGDSVNSVLTVGSSQDIVVDGIYLREGKETFINIATDATTNNVVVKNGFAQMDTVIGNPVRIQFDNCIIRDIDLHITSANNSPNIPVVSVEGDNNIVTDIHVTQDATPNLVLTVSGDNNYVESVEGPNNQRLYIISGNDNYYRYNGSYIGTGAASQELGTGNVVERSIRKNYSTITTTGAKAIWPYQFDTYIVTVPNGSSLAFNINSATALSEGMELLFVITNNHSGPTNITWDTEFILPNGFEQINPGETKVYRFRSFSSGTITLLKDSELNTTGDCVVVGTIFFDSAKTVGIFHGTGDPEGSITASVGSTFHRTDGGASTTLYVKESGTGNTGWVAK
ncbi:hypothetical protein KDA11_02690, partial [Candidatus Saccharibacteria bacterium]|nr:hypothetical protein [Candidatus Saccharibacteria bacterium]